MLHMVIFFCTRAFTLIGYFCQQTGDNKIGLPTLSLDKDKWLIFQEKYELDVGKTSYENLMSYIS